MKIIKRSGTEMTFDGSKIIAAIEKANESVVESERLSDEQIRRIYRNVEDAILGMKRSPNVEEIHHIPLQKSAGA